MLGLWVGLMSTVRPQPRTSPSVRRRVDVVRDRCPTLLANRREITDALGKTAQIAIPGYLVGLVLGAGVAALFELSTPVRRTATPFMIALRCVPIVAIAPLLVQAFGRGLSGTILTVAILTFFPTLVACSQGLRQTPGQVLDFYAVYDVSRAADARLGPGPGDVAGVLRRGSDRRAGDGVRRRPSPSGWPPAPAWAT